MARPADQSRHDVRFEWGVQGLNAVADPGLAAVVIVDVLSFTTCVTLPAHQGAIVLPYAGDGPGARAHAEATGSLLAGPHGAQYSLSPATMQTLSPGRRIVLPSPNGSTISVEAAAIGKVVAGSLLNRNAVASYLSHVDGPIAAIAAGERWPDGSLRPCLEDLVGAGAIIAATDRTRSPEAEAAVAAFEQTAGDLLGALRECTSGRELIERGYEGDVELAASLDSLPTVPLLTDGAYRIDRPATAPRSRITAGQIVTKVDRR